MLVAARSLTTSRVVSLGWRTRAATPQTGSTPSGTFHLIGSIQPVREDSTRSEGVESSRSGVTPHRQQASSRSWPPASSPIIADDASPTFNCARPGSHAPARGIAPVREPDTRGNGGGFAPCEPLWRCVVGVSEPWMAQIPPLGGGDVAVQDGEAPTSTRFALSPQPRRTQRDSTNSKGPAIRPTPSSIPSTQCKSSDALPFLAHPLWVSPLA